MLTEMADDRARHLIPRLLARAWQKLKKAARGLDDDSPDEEWHRVRIKAKRARYATEAVIPALNGSNLKGAKRFAGGTAAVQETLGGLQDAAVAQATITRCLKEAGKDPVLHFAAGRLYERESHLADNSRVSFAKTWAKLDRRKNLLWLTNDDR
jgi:CHAD domain-containing protein